MEAWDDLFVFLINKFRTFITVQCLCHFMTAISPPQTCLRSDCTCLSQTLMTVTPWKVNPQLWSASEWDITDHHSADHSKRKKLEGKVIKKSHQIRKLFSRIQHLRSHVINSGWYELTSKFLILWNQHYPLWIQCILILLEFCISIYE